MKKCVRFEDRWVRGGVVLTSLLLLCIVRWSLSDSLVEEIDNFLEIKCKDLICFAINDNLSVLDYVSRENKEFNLYERLGQNMSIFSYLITNEQKISLNVYDPNIRENNGTNKESILRRGIDGSKGENINYNGNDNNTGNGGVNKDSEVVSERIEYTKEQLSDFNFLCNNFYVVTERAELLSEDLIYDEMMKIDNRIKGSNENPQILIYHTHSHEGFVDTEGKNTSNIVAVGAYLAEVLSSEYGYNVIHCTQSFDEVNGVFDRSKAYSYATPAIEKILEQYPTVEVVLDVHRDGLKEGSDKLLTTINGKPTAKVMFFNGISRNKNGEIKYLYNKFRKENLALSFKMKLKAMELFPDFSRRNYIDAYQYNLHLRGNSMLIEVGAQNNTFEEAKNAMEPLAKLLDSVFMGE